MIRPRMTRIVTALLFFGAPLAFFTRAAEGFTLTKEILAAAALAYLLASTGRGPIRHVGREGTVRWALLFVSWTLGISLITAAVRTEVFRGAIHYLLLAGGLLAVRLASSSDPAFFRRALRWSVLSGAVMALIGILQAAGLDRSFAWTARFDGRVFSTMGNPNFLGGHLAALLPLAFLLALSSRGRIRFAGGVAALLMLATLLISRVRGSFLALAAGLGVAGLLLLAAPAARSLARSNRRLLWGGVALAALLALGTIVRMGGFGAFSLQGETARQRLDTWRAAWIMVKEAPLLGRGVEQLKILYPAYQHRPFRPSEYAAHPFTQTEHVHNEFLRIHLEGGLVGLALFLILLASVARDLGRRLADPGLDEGESAVLVGVAGGATAVLVQSLSNFPLQIAPTTVLFALYLAAPATGPSGGGATHPSRGPGIPLAAMGLVLLVGFRALSISVATRNLSGELQLGNLNRAGDFGRRLLALDPANYKGWFNYGKVHEAARLPATAIEDYQRAFRINPYYVEALTAEAALQAENGQDILAFVAAEKAARIAPNYAAPHFIRGASLFKFGRFSEAAEAFEAATRVLPDHFDSWMNLGTCRVKAGDRAGAVEAWSRALRLRPGDPTVTAYLRANGVPVPSP